jgi:hypothetical protein
LIMLGYKCVIKEAIVSGSLHSTTFCGINQKFIHSSVKNKNNWRQKLELLVQNPFLVLSDELTHL